MARWLLRLLNIKWVVFDTNDGPSCPELGISILGCIFALYKGEVYIVSDVAYIRKPGKREFGESLHPTGEWREHASR